MTTTVPETQPTLAEQMADGLRRLAAFVEANPGLADDLAYPLHEMASPYIGPAEGARAYLAEYARAGAKAGAEVKKVTVTEVVETFEWRCLPLLADREPAEVQA